MTTFATALPLDHRVIARADLLRDGLVVRQGLPVIDGKVDVDGSAKVRRRCSLSVVDEDLAPLLSTDLLSPYGNELALYRGIEGTTEVIWPIGVFRIDESSVDYDGVASISLTGYDRSVAVADAKLEVPVTYAVGTNFGTAITGQLTTALPSVQTNFVSVTDVTPLLVFLEGSDPWENAQEMASSIGMELFFDVRGVATLRPAASGEVVATLEHGESSTLVSFGSSLATGATRNRVIVSSGGNIAPPVRAIATDSNPASATYYGGTFGKRVEHIVDEKVTTVAQAQTQADAALASYLGGTQQVSVVTIPDPRREPGDVVRIAVAPLGYDESGVVESFDIPLGYSSLMTLTVKAQQVA